MNARVRAARLTPVEDVQEIPGLYLRQFQAGEMANFVYAVGCEETRRCLLVDPAWAIDELLEAVGEDGYEVEGALVTHYHPDHCGGSIFGLTLPLAAASVETSAASEA